MAKKDLHEDAHSRKEMSGNSKVAVHYDGGQKPDQGQDIHEAMVEPITCGEIEEIRKSMRIKNAGRE